MPATANHLLNRLPGKERARLLDIGKDFELICGDVLCKAGQPTRHVYFPYKGYIALVTEAQGSPGVEAGLVGDEGMLGAELALSVAKSPLHAVVQAEGWALPISTQRFVKELESSPVLRRCMGRYIYVLMAQHATSAVCLRFHSISERLARWLLMRQDRAHSGNLDLAQKSVALMLGVRRSSITAAASDMHRCGLIEYRRAHLSILDRPGLETASCNCYEENLQAYRQLLD